MEFKNLYESEAYKRIQMRVMESNNKRIDELIDKLEEGKKEIDKGLDDLMSLVNRL